MQESDAQDVLLKLSVELREFRYDPSRSFRAWLKTVAHHALSDFLAGRNRAGLGSGDGNVLDQLHSVEARDDLSQRLEEAFDQELARRTMDAVRDRVEPHTWEAFRLTAVEGLSGAEAAARVGMNVAAVFVARSKVQKMIQEEVRRLDAGPAETGGVP